MRPTMFHWATFRVEADRRKRNDGRAVGVICGGGHINQSLVRAVSPPLRDNRDKQMCCTSRAAGTGSRELKLKEQEEKKHVYEPKRG